MIFKSDKGPLIKADFFIKNGMIIKIRLVPSSSCSWEVFSEDHRNEMLEKKISSWMICYSSGKAPEERLPFDLEGLTPFTELVLNRLYVLPFGSSMSYKELATSLCRPRAARAVGGACGRNPLPLLIPCHRILASSKQIGGFSSGLLIKKELLQHEGIPFII